jgi:hypothetical protein
MNEWQRVATGTDRLRIEGGYLYRTQVTHSHGDEVSIAMVFVRDRKRKPRSVDEILERIYAEGA